MLLVIVAALWWLGSGAYCGGFSPRAGPHRENEVTSRTYVRLAAGERD